MSTRPSIGTFQQFSFPNALIQFRNFVFELMTFILVSKTLHVNEASRIEDRYVLTTSHSDFRVLRQS